MQGLIGPLKNWQSLKNSARIRKDVGMIRVCGCEFPEISYDVCTWRWL